jgi:TolA-binding protein
LLDRFPQSSFVVDALSGIQYCLIAQGKQQEAVQLIDQYLQAHPNVSVAEELLLKKADFLYNQQQYAEAVRALQAFTERYPSSKHLATALYWSAKSLSALNRIPEAAVFYERAASSAQAPAQLAATSLFEAAMISFRQKQYDQALRLFSNIESKFAQTTASPEASYMKGQIFWENGDAQEAAHQFEFVIRTYPSSDGAAKSKVSLARISLQSGDSAKARSYAHEVATTRNDAIGAEAQYLLATIFAERKDWNNAVTAYLRVRYVFPSYEEWVTKAYLGLGIAYENLNDLRKAKEAYQNVLRLKKDEPSVVEAERRLQALEKR